MDTFNHGWGKLQTRSGPRVTGSSSIITRLAFRSLTGQSLHIEVHQHYGFSFHFNWQFIRDCVSYETCMEREYVKFRDVDECLDQLKRRLIEGLYSCIYGGDEAELCFRTPPLQSDYDLTISISWAKFIHIYTETDRCCTVKSRDDGLIKLVS